MHTDDTTHDTIPYGYCQCGCGDLAPVATKTNQRHGHIKGQPMRYILGHRKMSRTRVCTSCARELPRNAFDRYQLKGKPKGWYSSCRECRAKNDARHIPIPRNDGSCFIPLTKGRFAIVDDDDAERVAVGKWSALETPSGNCYAVRYDGDTFTYLHRFIMNTPDGMEVDHINHDGLDCRKANMRNVTGQQNKWNMPLLSTNSSGYRGVHWSAAVEKWKAVISDNKRQVTLGYFDDPADAARVYDERLREIAGEYGSYNFPREGEHGVV